MCVSVCVSECVCGVCVWEGGRERSYDVCPFQSPSQKCYSQILFFLNLNAHIFFLLIRFLFSFLWCFRASRGYG